MLSAPLAETLRERPLVALPLLFGAGLLTSFTPCVYPMIPITAGLLGGAGAAGRPGAGARRHGRALCARCGPRLRDARPRGRPHRLDLRRHQHATSGRSSSWPTCCSCRDWPCWTSSRIQTSSGAAGVGGAVQRRAALRRVHDGRHLRTGRGALWRAGVRRGPDLRGRHRQRAPRASLTCWYSHSA